VRDPGPARVYAARAAGRAARTATVNINEPGAAGSGAGKSPICCASSVDRRVWGPRSVFVAPGPALWTCFSGRVCVVVLMQVAGVFGRRPQKWTRRSLTHVDTRSHTFTHVHARSRTFTHVHTHVYTRSHTHAHGSRALSLSL
jgi:hypothetical protein